MVEYKGYQYPTFDEAMKFYKVGSGNGGFNRHEAAAPYLFVKLPYSGIILSTMISKEDISNAYNKHGCFTSEDKERFQKQIDSVCQSYYDAISAGDLDV
jgi:hypothetical protein